MKLSIKFKLVIIFALVFIFSTFLTVGMLYFLLDDAIIEDKATGIKNDAGTLREMLTRLNSQEEVELFKYYMNILSSNLNYIIVVADTQGKIIMSAPQISAMEAYEDAFEYDINEDAYYFPKESQYRKLPDGEQYSQEIGNFYGFFEHTKNVPWLTVRTSLTSNSYTVGTLYIFSPTPEILKIKSRLNEIFILASSISLILSIFLIYIYSSWFIKPIRKLKYASKEVAKGNYNETVRFKTKDEIGQLAKNFNYMTEELKRLEESRKSFIANASHELRSPMTSIKGFIDAILDEVVPENKVDEYLKIIKEEINRLSMLVTNLLDVAKFESDEMKLNFEVFNINEVLRNTISRMEPFIIEKGIRVHAIFEHKTLNVEADREMIERVCLNLIQNSIKYTRENGDIYLKTKKIKGKVYVSVKDNGQGIDKEEIKLIWDRFYKTDRSRGVDKLGVGLGLSIVKKIMDAHEQEIFVESEPNIKTVFTITLKYVQ